uniref:sugar ABC transporter ATP-binding protein n=1 Tax=Faecousia sp. TaxID=2952921 RepID=UPI004028014A
MTNEVILSVEGVSKSFLGTKALDKVSLEVCKGEVHGVIGENGAGKSTLMNTIFGSLQRDEGTIRFMGEEVHFKCPADALKNGISMIHQETNLVQQFTASENIWLGMEKRFMKGGHLDNGARDRKTQELFDEYGISLHYDDVAGQISMAACQMIEVIRAVACGAKLIIMDEPTSSLSENEVEILFRMIRKLTQQGVAVIYISHKIEEIMEICDRLSVYRDGHYIGTRLISEIDHGTIVSMVVGRELTNLFPKSEPNIGEVILDVKNLSKYGKFRDVSFQLHKGEILGFAGLEGAGRSEVASCIFGIDQPDSGEIYLDGKKVSIASPSAAVELGIGMVTEDRLRRGIVAQMSVKDNMTIARLGKFCSRFLGSIRRKEEEAACDDMIKTMQVKVSDRNQRIDSLSGGNQQKVIIGRWVMTAPRILILDEPTRGIDVGSKSEIHRLMSSFVEQGMSIILISSEMPELLGMADRIVVMREGNAVYTCDREEATQETLGKYVLG